MVIECSSCHARFKLADEKVKESGTKVRCTKCREVFTVFPVLPSPIITPVVAVPPVVTNETVFEDDFFSDTPPVFATTAPSPAVAAPVADEDDWEQETASSHFDDDAGASDLDAINFDNFESPIFSVTTEKSSELEFADDTAFSFEDSSVAGKAEQHYQIAAATDDQTLAAPAITSADDRNQTNTITTEGEFTFPAAKNLADFSWEEMDDSPGTTVTAEETTEVPTSPPDTTFDFSSFSFDDDLTPVAVEGDEETRSVAQRDTTIELAMETETPNEPTVTHPSPPVDLDLPRTPLALTDREESSSPLSRQIRARPRSRKMKKSSSRRFFKVTFLIFLLLVLAYGIINRDQLQKMYKNKVSGFIETQVAVETNGKIGLVKLSGGYLLNLQEGDLFVIRGEAINEFKELRSSVLVRGTIYDENGTVIQSQSAYGGNPLPDNSLKKLRFQEIRNIMNKELGENLVNLNIPPGKGIPFTLVFNKVPKNIKEFSVEVLESKPGSK